VRLSFRAKLVVSHLGLVALIAALMVFLLERALTADLTAELDARLEQQAAAAVPWVQKGKHPEGIAARLSAIAGAGVTILDERGHVLGDSEEMEPGADDSARPEMIAARGGRTGFDSRLDRTGARIRYVAVPAGERVVRLRASLDAIEATRARLHERLLLTGGIGLLVALLIAVLVARSFARPLQNMSEAANAIANGDYSQRPNVATPDEFGALSHALSELAAQLEADMGRIRKLEALRREFLANVSHELRTPVTAIQGYAETLLEGSADPETARRFLEITHRQAKRISALVAQLLELAELDARPAGPARRESIDVKGLLDQVAALPHEQAAGRVLEVSVEGAPLALGDPYALEHAVENLVDNALKHGRGRVRLSARGRGDKVELTVEDEGPGIAAEHRARLFERFYRVDPARSRERGGAGLGLAIVSELVHAMGGSVSVRSELGKGTALTIELPAAG